MTANDIEKCGEYGGLGGSCLTASDVEELWKLYSEVMFYVCVCMYVVCCMCVYVCVCVYVCCMCI